MRIVTRCGDAWERRPNNGIIERHVKSVACETVLYTSNGHFVRCSLASFKKWASADTRVCRFLMTRRIEMNTVSPPLQRSSFNRSILSLELLCLRRIQ